MSGSSDQRVWCSRRPARCFCGDVRVSRRFGRIREDATRCGSLVVRKLGGDRAGEIAAHRFLGSERTTPQAILDEAAERTARACPGSSRGGWRRKTAINFRGRDKGRRDLGRGDNGTSLGSFIHPLVAIDAVPRVAGAKILTRPARRGEDASPETASGGQGIRALDRGGGPWRLSALPTPPASS